MISKCPVSGRISENWTSAVTRSASGDEASDFGVVVMQESSFTGDWTSLLLDCCSFRSVNITTVSQRIASIMW